MSLKPVELQIALPRTTDAGKVQHGLQHRPAVDQQQLAGQNVKQSSELAHRSTEVDESAESALRNDDSQEIMREVSPLPINKRNSRRLTTLNIPIRADGSISVSERI